MVHYRCNRQNSYYSVWLAPFASSARLATQINLHESGYFSYFLDSNAFILSEIECLSFTVYIYFSQIAKKKIQVIIAKTCRFYLTSV